jgi:hypothetical protein
MNLKKYPHFMTFSSGFYVSTFQRCRVHNRCSMPVGDGLYFTALSQDFERVPIVLSASEVLPRDLLTGPNYTVKDVVISDGLINIYELDTLYGPLKVESTALLLKRISELKAINQSKLSAMGVEDSVAQALLKNDSYDPQEKTLLVGALANMVGVNAPAVYIQNATAAHDESIALFMRVRAQLMELYNEKSGPVATFINANGTPFLLTKEGKAIGIFPLDYIAWTPRLSQKEATISAALQAMPGISGKELWIMGKVDAEARKALERRGWKVEDNIQERFFKKLHY